MEENANKYVVFVDTSYLTYMPAAEKADWNIILEHTRKCVADIDFSPGLEIHISEISLREYRGKMRDDLAAKISKVDSRINELQREWHGNILARELDLPFSFDDKLFPKRDDIDSAADRVIKGLLDGGIKQVDMQNHHNEKVLEKYFKWEPPFDVQSDAEKDDRNVRDKRRSHIPDAWILEAALDNSMPTDTMLCLCKDEKLSNALELHGHRVLKTSKDVLDILFPTEVEVTLPPNQEVEIVEDDQLCPLDELLSKSINSTVRDINLRILGFVSVLDTPSHEELVDAISSKGFDRRLIEACAVILSDKSAPFVRDTGSHFIVWNKEICAEAADRLTDEIIAMLGAG
ncbi:MAG: hypothetical protein RPU60_00160 [Candidatus Sedimenticola sp. (ex Thyasira tokunagai)]